MAEHGTQSNEISGKGFFSFLYRTRIQVRKGPVVILNLSLLFSILSLLVAPWLVIGGAIAAIALGYRFSVEKNAQGFAASPQEVVQNAAANVQSAVESFAQEKNP